MSADEKAPRAPSPERKPCVACFEPILPRATRCPQCGSAQKENPWRFVATGLAWVGGATAVISLVLASAQLSELVESWREHAKALDQLAKAAEIQMKAGNPGGAFRALRGSPGTAAPLSDPAIQDVALSAAMAELRKGNPVGDEGFIGLVQRLQPTLLQASGRSEGVLLADVLAHIGWSNFLMRRGGEFGLEITRYYEQALEQDRANVYAHAMLGHWILWPGSGFPEKKRFELAREHFEAALASGRDGDYANEMMISAWLNVTSDEYNIEALRAANAVRLRGGRLSSSNRETLVRLYTSMNSENHYQHLLPALSREDHIDTLVWLGGTGDTSLSRSTWTLGVLGRLLVEHGDLEKARAVHAALAPVIDDGQDEPLRQALKDLGDG